MRHFAGDVAYDVAQFIAKNSETMETMTAALLQAPGLQFLAAVAPNALEAAAAAAAEAAAEASGGRGMRPEEARKAYLLISPYVSLHLAIPRYISLHLAIAPDTRRARRASCCGASRR